ncbi:hypothetical protein An11g05610 [Aspergillus niger]|uniref:Uncharacterized protein n=2 Tax=Aspergillus niger TaxID=5061 RepID=A2QWL4_ASPNC|nr:hypothetical protein An11g05610 [Aspergillus niger]CAK40718.1 hypothetical protein An11g05610 [Aspergillus niger]
MKTGFAGRAFTYTRQSKGHVTWFNYDVQTLFMPPERDLAIPTENGCCRSSCELQLPAGLARWPLSNAVREALIGDQRLLGLSSESLPLPINHVDKQAWRQGIHGIGKLSARIVDDMCCSHFVGQCTLDRGMPWHKTAFEYLGTRPMKAFNFLIGVIQYSRHGGCGGHVG